jgi:hypothetical protein
MSLMAWLLMGAGIFILYSAYKGSNPLTSLATHLGVTAKSPAKLSGAK